MVLQKLLVWLKAHDDAPLLDDCQRYLEEEFGLHLSIPTISRHLRKSTGGFKPSNKIRRAINIPRDAEGRMLDLALSSPVKGTTPQEEVREQQR
jgi:hypothetical protein